MSLAALAAGVLAAALPAATPATEAQPPGRESLEAAIARASGGATGRVIYADVTLVDAGAPAARPGVAIVVDGERIAAVVPMAAVDAALRQGATIVDGRGLFAVPGLIDAHTHSGTLPNRARAELDLRRTLYGGVTAVRDMAGDARFLADLARSSQLHQIPAPDLFYSALVAGPDFFADPRTRMASLGATPGQVPWLQAITPATDLRLAVALARGTSAAGLKIYANLAGAEVRRVIGEARRQGFPVWGHLAVYPAIPDDMLGATSVSHVGMLARYVLEPRKQAYGHADEPDYARLDPRAPEILRYARALAAAGTILDATLSVYARAGAPAADGKRPGCSRELAGAVVRAMRQEGVKVAAGTDTDAAPDDPFPALHGELEALVRDAGMTPAQALDAATIHAARATGIDRDHGSLAPGKFASFVLLEADPLADVANLRSIRLTVKRGRVYPRADYHHVPIPESDP